MRRPATLSAALALATCLAACGQAGSPDAAPVAAIEGTAMEFRGQRPCADCAGIDSWLRLEQHGRARRYRLVENYRSGGSARRFEDAGAWSAEGDLLRLRSGTGGERVYARVADGTLQARDARGAALPAAADDVLLPVTFDTVR